MKSTVTGDTIVSGFDKLKSATLVGVDIPEAVFTCSIAPESSSDAKAFGDALACMQREDPSVRVSLSEETGQQLLRSASLFAVAARFAAAVVRAF